MSTKEIHRKKDIINGRNRNISKNFKIIYPQVAQAIFWWNVPLHPLAKRNVAYYSQVNQGLRRYKNVITKSQSGLCSLYKQCINHDNSNTRIYLALFLHINIIIVDSKYHNNFLKIASLFRMKLNAAARFVYNLGTYGFIDIIY